MDEKQHWQNERIAFFALTSLKGVGFWSLHKIASSGSSFKEALKNLENSGFGTGNEDSTLESLWAQGLAIGRQLLAADVRLIFQKEPSFPRRLIDIVDAPHWLFVQGDQTNLDKPSVTIVGTRKPSSDGLFLTRCVMACLARSSKVTVSGLALGIDQTVHEESLRYGMPTVAVLGTGIWQDYPKGSEVLRKAILSAGGTIITEYLPSQSYSRENFVRRNRLQAALGDALIPTEWNIKSGTAHTVKFASIYGKPIINVSLPFSDSIRPELTFSKKEYGASTLEMPAGSKELLQLFPEKDLALNRPTADEPLNYDLAESNIGSPADSQTAEDTQLQLL